MKKLLLMMIISLVFIHGNDMEQKYNEIEERTEIATDIFLEKVLTTKEDIANHQKKINYTEKLQKEIYDYVFKELTKYNKSANYNPNISLLIEDTDEYGKKKAAKEALKSIKILTPKQIEQKINEKYQLIEPGDDITVKTRRGTISGKFVKLYKNKLTISNRTVIISDILNKEILPLLHEDSLEVYKKQKIQELSNNEKDKIRRQKVTLQPKYTKEAYNKNIKNGFLLKDKKWINPKDIINAKINTKITDFIKKEELRINEEISEDTRRRQEEAKRLAQEKERLEKEKQEKQEKERLEKEKQEKERLAEQSRKDAARKAKELEQARIKRQQEEEEKQRQIQVQKKKLVLAKKKQQKKEQQQQEQESKKFWNMIINLFIGLAIAISLVILYYSNDKVHKAVNKIIKKDQEKEDLSKIIEVAKHNQDYKKNQSSKDKNKTEEDAKSSDDNDLKL